MNKQPPQSSSPSWSSRTRRTVTLIVAGLGLLGLLWVSDVLPLLIVAVVLAYLLTPIVNGFDARVLNFKPLRDRPHRGLAVMLTFTVVILFFILIVLLVVPLLIGQIEEFGSNLPELLVRVEAELERILSEPLLFNGQPILLNGQPIIPLERLREVFGTGENDDVFQFENFDFAGMAQTFLGSVGGLTGPAFSFVGGAVNTVINISFMVTMMFYLMKDGGRFADNLVQITPEPYRGDVRRLLWELARVWNAYLRGQIILGLVMGTSVFIVATLLGVPNAPILGLLSGLLEFIPNLGPFLALIPAAFFGLVSQSATLPFLGGLPFAIVIVLVWTGLQNIEAIILVPRVMGDNLDLHPFVVIVAVLAGASVAGALGIILAAPFVASARVLAQYVYGKMTDQNPFPEHRSRRVTWNWAVRLWSPLLRRQRALPIETERITK